MTSVYQPWFESGHGCSIYPFMVSWQKDAIRAVSGNISNKHNVD